MTNDTKRILVAESMARRAALEDAQLAEQEAAGLDPLACLLDPTCSDADRAIAAENDVERTLRSHEWTAQDHADERAAMRQDREDRDNWNRRAS